MRTEIQLFNNPEFGDVRTSVTESNEPIFCLLDLCEILELNPSKVSQRLNDDVLSKYPIFDRLGREQLANFVNEDGLYDVILDSRKPEARGFRKWVTSEVLPTIRKTGGYMVSKPLSQLELIIQSAQALLEQEKRMDNVEREIKEIKAQTITRPDYFTVAGYATLNGISCGLKLASSLGRKASLLCKSRDIDTESIPDPRFGRVKTYPMGILEEVFEMAIV